VCFRRPAPNCRPSAPPPDSSWPGTLSFPAPCTHKSYSLRIPSINSCYRRVHIIQVSQDELTELVLNAANSLSAKRRDKAALQRCQKDDYGATSTWGQTWIRKVQPGGFYGFTSFIKLFTTAFLLLNTHACFHCCILLLSMILIFNIDFFLTFFWISSPTVCVSVMFRQNNRHSY